MPSSPISLLDRLRTAVSQRQITQSEIAVATGVNQSQVSRILAGPVKRFSENVQKLCAFAQALPSIPAESGDHENEAFTLLGQILEGSPQTKRGVVELMRSLLTLKRQYEKDAREST